MRVTFDVDTKFSQDLKALIGFLHAMQAIPEVPEEPGPETKVVGGRRVLVEPETVADKIEKAEKLDPVPATKTAADKIEKVVEKPKPEPKAEKAPPKKAKEPEPKFEKMDFDELAEIVPTLDKQTNKHARFMAKQFCVKLGDAKAGKAAVREVLGAFNATNFSDLNNPAGFISHLIDIDAETGESNDDLDI